MWRRTATSASARITADARPRSFGRASGTQSPSRGRDWSLAGRVSNRPLHRSPFCRVAPMIALLLANAAEEGRHVVTGMLITGLIFLAVIALGETSRWLRHRRR